MSYFTQEGFSEGVPENLMLFDLPPTQVAVNDIYYQEVRALSQVSDDSPIEFRISGQNSMDYLDLKGTQLHVKLKVTNANGTDITSKKVGPVNLFLQALFSATEVTLQNKAIITCNYNPYRAMIHTLMYYGHDAASSQLLSQLFIKDDNDHPEDCDAEGGNNGLYMRHQIMATSKTFDLQGPIYHSLFTTKRYLLNQVDVKLKLYRSSSAFCLSAGDTSPDFKVEILDIYLLARKLRVNPALIIAHSEMLKSSTAKYPFDRVDCRSQSLAAGSTMFTWDNLFQGHRPNRVIVGFVKSKALSGDYKSNPFHFLNCKIQSICLYVDGIPVGGNPLKLNFDKTDGRSFMRAYTNLFLTNGAWNKNSGLDLSTTDFANTSTLFAFQLEPIFPDDTKFLSLVKTGHVRLDVQFKQALSETISCIVYSESPGFFQINKERDIITE